MKKISVMTFVIMFAMTSVSLAADNESWIQKIKNRFQKKEVTAAGKIEPAKEVKKAGAPKKQRKDMTKGELAADITKNLDREDAILDLVQGLEKKIDPDGKDYYTYQGGRLEDLDRDTLDNIFGRVRSEALRLRTDKLNRQIETVRRAETIQRISRPPLPPPVANLPPQVPRAVQPPSRPAQPPAPPRR